VLLQKRQVLHSIYERQELDLNHGQSVEEILPKLPLDREFSHIAISGSDHMNIDGAGNGRTDPP